jgi:hypothetical protein
MRIRASVVVNSAIIFAFVGSSSIAHAENDSVEIKLPPLTQSIPGEQSSDAFDASLQSDQIKTIVEKFHPVDTGFNWTLQDLTAKDGVTFFKMNLQKTAKDLNSSSSTSSSSGWWGYMTTVVTEASSYMSQMISADLVGEITQSEAECEEPFLKRGYHLAIDLRNSSYLLSALVQETRLQVCFAPSGDSTGGAITLFPSIVPGFQFPGMEDSRVKKIVQAQSTAWADALSKTVSDKQVELVQRADP